MPEQRAHRGFRLVLTPEEGREAGRPPRCGLPLGLQVGRWMSLPPLGVRARSSQKSAAPSDGCAVDGTCPSFLAWKPRPRAVPFPR